MTPTNSATPLGAVSPPGLPPLAGGHYEDNGIVVPGRVRQTKHFRQSIGGFTQFLRQRSRHSSGYASTDNLDILVCDICRQFLVHQDVKSLVRPLFQRRVDGRLDGFLGEVESLDRVKPFTNGIRVVDGAQRLERIEVVDEDGHGLRSVDAEEGRESEEKCWSLGLFFQRERIVVVARRRRRRHKVEGGGIVVKHRLQSSGQFFRCPIIESEALERRQRAGRHVAFLLRRAQQFFCRRIVARVHREVAAEPWKGLEVPGAGGILKAAQDGRQGALIYSECGLRGSRLELEDGVPGLTAGSRIQAGTTTTSSVRMLHFIGNRIPADGAGKPWVPSLLQGPNRILICSPDQQLYFLIPQGCQMPTRSYRGHHRFQIHDPCHDQSADHPLHYFPRRHGWYLDGTATSLAILNSKQDVLKTLQAPMSAILDIEAQRLQNLQQKQKLLEELNLPNFSQPTRHDNTTKTTRPAAKKRRLNHDAPTGSGRPTVAPVRTSARIAAAAAASQAESSNRINTGEEHESESDGPNPSNIRRPKSTRTTKTNPRSQFQAKLYQQHSHPVLSPSPSPSRSLSALLDTYHSWTPTAPEPILLSDGTYHFSSHPDFRPNKSPLDILLEGAFGGSYFSPWHSRTLNLTLQDDYLRTLPPSWLDQLRPATKYITSPTYDATLNKYGVACGQSLSQWEDAGWINFDYDPRGWFEWYIRFWLGRRCGGGGGDADADADGVDGDGDGDNEDDRQVGRWVRCVGPRGRWRRMLLKKYVDLGVRSVFDDDDDDNNDQKVSPVMHQTCHHWAYEVRQCDLDDAWRERTQGD
ncbi:hypothetical protein KCU88_g148, partial [Aureobasidium melanogenum]